MIFRIARFRITACVIAMVAIAAPALVLAQRGDDEQTAADLLPSTCIALVEIARPGQLLTTLEDHRIWHEIQERPEYQQAIANPGYLFVQAIRTNIEQQIGMSWREAFDALLGSGVTVAFDPATDGAVLLIQSRDAEKLDSVSKKLIRLVQQDAKSKGKPPIPENTYRDVTVYGSGNARMAMTGRWIVVTNKAELGRKTLDAILDGSETSLSKNERFRAARAALTGPSTLWSWLDLQTVRDAGLVKALNSNQTENPAAELLIGGILTNLRQTPFVTGALNISNEAVKLTFATPHKSEWVEEFREYWFGPDSKGAAEALIKTESTIFSLSAYRNVSDMWLRAGDLFNERMNDELAKADANLTTFFAGRDFGEDILGSFTPEMQIVVNRQDFTHVKPVPAIRFPSFALTGHLKDSETTKTELRRTFQSMIGFLNVVGAMEGNPQLDQDVEFHGDAKIYTATFVPEPDERDSDRARVQFNFSPSLAFSGDRFFIASTKQIAKDLIDATKAPAEKRLKTSNTVMRLDTQSLGTILKDNIEQLIAQNMVEKGHSREEAAKEIGIALELLQLVRNASVDLRTSAGQLTLELLIETN